jgi:hypothetical protein
MVPPKVSRSTMAGDRRRSLNVLIQPPKNSMEAIAMFLPIASGIVCRDGGRRSTDLVRNQPSVLVTAASVDRA